MMLSKYPRHLGFDVKQNQMSTPPTWCHVKSDELAQYMYYCFPLSFFFFPAQFKFSVQTKDYPRFFLNIARLFE